MLGETLPAGRTSGRRRSGIGHFGRESCDGSVIPVHSLLARQLRKARAADESVDLDRLFALVSFAYAEADRERGLNQDSFGLMSEEMLALNRKLLAEAKENVDKARASLHAQEVEHGRLAASLDSMSHGIALFDLDDRLVTCNPAYRSKHPAIADILVPSVSFEEIVRTNVARDRFDLSSQDQETSIRRRLDQHRAASAPVERKLSDGRWEQATDELLPDGSRILVLSDITERKLAEKQLVQAKAAAEAANVAKSQFLANMSHEIRTPLNGVLGMMELLLDTDLSGKQRRFAQTVRSSGHTLLGLINSILDLSKIEAGKLELDVAEFDSHRLIEETIDSVAGRAHAKGLELSFLVDEGVPRSVVGDSGRLRQILTNLLGNAVKFTEQGEVALRVTVVPSESDALVLHFEILDTGIGIAAEVMERIFESFAQAGGSTTRQYGGTGRSRANWSSSMADRSAPTARPARDRGSGSPRAPGARTPRRRIAGRRRKTSPAGA